MKKLLYILFLLPLLSFGQVFDTAVGFGADWTFTSDYEVRIVTNLNGSGAGSLLSAVETTTSNAGIIIVFNGLSGTITLSENLTLQNAKQTYIAGQTSENGILIKMDSATETGILNTTGSPSGVIVRGLTFALGPGQTTAETTPATGLPTPSAGSGDGSGNVNGDNVTISGGADFIFDHCTFLWSTDESINPYGADDITFQYCIIGESLMYATHAYTTDSGSGGYFAPHSMGMLIGNGSNNVTIYNTAFANNNQRNPIIQPPVAGGGQYEIVTTVLYNMGNFGMLGADDDGVITLGAADINFINNYAIAGSNTSTSRYPIAINSNITAYARGNINWKRTDSADAEWDAIGCESGCAGYMTANANVAWQTGTAHAFPLANESTITASEILTSISANAGTFTRNTAEQRVINEIIAGTGVLIDDPSDVGGYPTIAAGTTITDADSDGIPDENEGAYVADTFSYLNDLASGTLVDSTPPNLVAPASIRLGSGKGGAYLGSTKIKG